MSSYGVTTNGFKRKPYTAILEEMQYRAKVLFGGNVNLSEKNPLGKFIQLQAWRESELWEVAEKVYYSGYIDDAEGNQLDSVIKYIAMDRKGEMKAKGLLTVIADESTTIGTNLIVGTKDGIHFSPTKNYTLESYTSTEIEIVCLQDGENGNVPVGAITEIITPVAGLDSIVNHVPTRDGRDIEEDFEVKDRYYRSLFKPGGASIHAVEGALLNIPNVKDVFVEENKTIEEVGGLPPKSIAPYVYGGDDVEIAETILSKKAGGIRSFGSTTITIIDSKGKEQHIGFTKAKLKDVYIKVGIYKNSRYPFNGDELIKNAIIKYIGGLDSNSVEHRGLRFNQDVGVNKLVGTADIDGVDDIVIELSLDGIKYSTSKIVIEKAEKAITDVSKVTLYETD